MANWLYIVYHIYAIIMMVVDIIDTSSVYYKNAPEMAGRKCSPADLMFSLTTKSDIVCAAICQQRTGCGSVFYNHVTGTCYGCYSYYDVHNTAMNLDVASNTTYYYPGLCNRGWIRHGDSCYILKEVGLTWGEALADCRALNASLIEVNDAAEDNFLRALVSDSQVWIGLNDRAEQGTFRWADSNTGVTYINWFPGEPSDRSGYENCVKQRKQGKWNDVPCTFNEKYVCEKGTSM